MQKHNPFIQRLLLILFALSILCSLSSGSVSHAAVSKLPRLNIKNLSLAKGSTYKLRLYNINKGNTVSFQSNDTDIAVIKSIKAKSCTIKAKSSGQAIITAIVNDENNETISELKCKVTVTPPAVSVKFCKKKVKLTVGQTRKVKVSKKPLSSFEQPRFISDNPDIVSVSSNGTLTAHSAGRTVIRVSIANGKGGICKVTVTDSNDTEKPDDNPDDNVSQTSAPTEPTAAPSDEPKYPQQYMPANPDGRHAKKMSN